MCIPAQKTDDFVYSQVALKLQPLIDARKKTDEWDIDAFGSSRTDRVDTREIEEAVGR